MVNFPNLKKAINCYKYEAKNKYNKSKNTDNVKLEERLHYRSKYIKVQYRPITKKGKMYNLASDFFEKDKYVFKDRNLCFV